MKTPVMRNGAKTSKTPGSLGSSPPVGPRCPSWENSNVDLRIVQLNDFVQS